MRTPEERLELLQKLALEFNDAMPREVILKGDGSIWVADHGRQDALYRKLTQEQVLLRIHSAIQFGNKMISV